jgi:hypothetical protein
MELTKKGTNLTYDGSLKNLIEIEYNLTQGLTFSYERCGNYYEIRFDFIRDRFIIVSDNGEILKISKNVVTLMKHLRANDCKMIVE